VAVGLTVACLGLGGVAYQAQGQSPVPQGRGEARPRSELEALRRENELLKLNLEVVLEKVRAQEAELRGLRGVVASAKLAQAETLLQANAVLLDRTRLAGNRSRLLVETTTAPDPVQELEAVVKALREARSQEDKQGVVQRLSLVLKKLNEQGKEPQGASRP